MIPEKFKTVLGDELYEKANEMLKDVDLIENDGSYIKDDGSYIKDDGTYIKADDENYIKKEDHEKIVNDLNDKMGKFNLDNEVDKFLMTSKVRNIKAIKGLLKNDVIKLKEGKLTGLEDQIKSLRESDGYLFDDYKPDGFGDDPNLGNNGNKDKKDNSDTSFVDCINENSLRK